jgi:hypothetical protein
MYLIPIFLLLNIIALISQITRRNKLRENLENAQEPEEIAAFQNAIDKGTRSIVFSIIALISLVILTVYLLNAPSY